MQSDPMLNAITKQIRVSGINDGRIPKSSTVIDKRSEKGISAPIEIRSLMTNWLENTEPIRAVVKLAINRAINPRKKLLIVMSHSIVECQFLNRDAYAGFLNLSVMRLDSPIACIAARFSGSSLEPLRLGGRRQTKSPVVA